MNKLKKNTGITLIALVISIIVMLILAGVSLNATIGENGIVTRAQQAKLVQEDATRREELEMILYKYNSSEFLGEADGFNKYLMQLKEDGTIEDYFVIGGQIVVKYQGTYYGIKQEGEYYAIGEGISTDLGENKEGGSYLVSSDNANDAGNLEFQKGSNYTIMEEINAEGFNFVIPSAEGDPSKAVTITLMANMTVDNKGYDRSAIELLPGAILNLHIENGAKVTVNSGYGKEGETNTGNGAIGGPGGYAGIHVPETATLNLYGDGTITCIGGNAGAGGSAISDDAGGAGGGGAGAGIGGNGGQGGNSNIDPSQPQSVKNFKRSGADGLAGENCGEINIHNSITVYAYGGAGASGGVYKKQTGSSGTGGGGYPAAGIGGGGAGAGGADHCDGGGGYCGGSNEMAPEGNQSTNRNME